MKNSKKNLKVNQLKKELKYDHLIGIFTRNGELAGHKCKKDNYIRIKINGYNYLAHRLAWFYYYGYWPEYELDHRDGIRYHNWILNLRESSRIWNMQNTGNPNTNTSGVKGVYWVKDRNTWQARITIKQKAKGLGYYKDFDNAVCARLAGEQCLDWAGCDSASPAYLYVKNNIQLG